MQVKVYCERCKKYSTVELKEQPKEKTQKNSFIPVPGTKSGLQTLSIVHHDHIIVADVDANGDIRGRRIIDRIDQDIEKTVAKVVNKLFELLESKNGETTFIILTNHTQLKKLLMAIFQQIMFNRNMNTQLILSVSDEKTILEYENLVIYVGGLTNELLTIASDNSHAVMHFHEVNEVLIKNYLKTAEKLSVLPKIQQTSIIFDQNYISKPEAKELLISFMAKQKVAIVLDGTEVAESLQAFVAIIDCLIR